MESLIEAVESSRRENILEIRNRELTVELQRSMARERAAARLLQGLVKNLTRLHRIMDNYHWAIHSAQQEWLNRLEQGPKSRDGRLPPNSI
jgi:hypothetical protein